MCLGYAPVSFAFAVSLAGQLPWYVILLFSLSNFTSAGQAAGSSLMVQGAPLPEMGLTVLLINLRYMLMSLSLSQKMQNIPWYKRMVLANGVTDEVFFLAAQQQGNVSGSFFVGLAFGPYLAAGIWLSALVGGQLITAYLSLFGL